MIARIKGLKISQATERVAVTGLEMIPFQDGERNGKIRMIEFKDMTMYVFDPTIVDGKISQEDYDDLKKAIEEGKLIYTVNADRTGLLLATEVSVDHGNIHMKSPGFKQETGTDNISLVIFNTTDINADLNYDKTSYATPALQTTGDGNKVLTNDGSYEYIGNLALTNIKFKDDSNTSVYDLITEAITFQQDNTPCVSWSTTKNGNNIYMKLNIAKANSSMDGLLSKEDYVELNTTIPNQIEDLQNQGEELENKIDQEIQDRKDEVVRLDGRINQEIADRKSEISRVDTKYLVITDNLNQSLQLEISDRKAADNTITDNLNAFKNTKGQPGGLAELDSTGKVPASLLPSYVDDVIEYPTLANFPATGETGKIYVARDTNLTYRWSGNQYIEISKSLALGETSSTAYPGDKGKANRDALNSTPINLISSFDTTTTTNELVKVNYKYVAKNGLNYSQPQDANVDIPAATESSAGAMTSIDKTRLNHLHDEFGTLSNPGDKLNTLPANLVTEIGEVTRDANKATINYKLSVLSLDNSYSIPTSRTTVIPAATDTLAGLMTPTDKTQFDRVSTTNFTLGNVTTDANTASINATKTDISTGNTVTNNVTIPAVTTTKAGVMTAADKVNLDTTIPNRITTLDNRVTTEVNNLNTTIANSVSNLTDTMNTELAKKVGKVTVAGSGNAVTTASISGDTLTLTKGATYNNYVHPAGSAPSKTTGFYKFSTDSTSHISGVSAVTKNDVVNLGIYDSSTVDSKFVTLNTAQTITGKKTFAGGLAITDGEENPSMPFFLGIDAFNDGGTVKWITASKVANAIGVYTKNDFTWANLLNKPTTLAGYGITDAKIVNGVITLGNNSITPLTTHLTLYTLTVLKNGANVGTYKPDKNSTINITDVASATNLTNHINNTTAHITSTERTKWNKVVTDFAAITGNDSDEIINKWEEVVAFLDNYTEANTLSDLLSHKADKTVKISAGTGITGGGDLSANRTLGLAASGVTAGTYTKMTVDQYGRVTAGATLSVDDVPGLPWSKITSGKPTVFPTNWDNVAGKPTIFPTNWANVANKPTWIGSSKPSYAFSEITGKPTTIAGYGITDAYTHIKYLDNRDENFLPYGEWTYKGVQYSIKNNSADGLSDGDSNYHGSMTLHHWRDSSGGAVHQLGFTHNGRMWMRHGTSSWSAWKRFAFMSDLTWANITGKPTIFPTNWANVANKPTTLAGYGITDAYTKSVSDSRYVNVAGDTMTGALTINAWGVNRRMSKDTSNYERGLAFISKEAGDVLATIGYHNTVQKLYLNPVGSDEVFVDAAGKYSLCIGNNHLTYNTYKLWHAGNDGSGSGLDADLLDGHQYQNILERSCSGSSKIGATGWFRIAETMITDGLGVSFLLFINRSFNNNNNESYIFSVNIEYNGGISITQLSGYANNRLITKIRIDYKAGNKAYVDFYVGESNSNDYFWYTVGNAKSYTSATAVTSLTGTAYEFTTVNGCKSDRGFTGSFNGNASSATKLQTARTIWGQSFDGTQNVSGNMTGVGVIYRNESTAPFLRHPDTGPSSAGNLNRAVCISYAPIYHGVGIWATYDGVCHIQAGRSDGTNTAYNLILQEFGGNVGIGTTTPAYKLDVAGTIHASGKISSPAGFWKESDIRLKSDIKPLTHTLDLICSIPTNSFIMNNTKQIGTIALELESIGFDELVSEDKISADSIDNKDTFEVFNENDTEYVKVKRVEYEMLSVIAIEGVKLLKDEIDKLKAEIETLKDK